MLFQTLDDKGECVGVYSDGVLHTKSLPDGLTKTWSYAPYLKNMDVKYARLFCHGATLEEVCPEELKPEWAYISNRLKAYLRSFISAKVSLSENCFFDLVPQRFLLEYCDIKNQISEHVFTNYPEPANYQFLSDLQEVVADISNQPLNLEPTLLDRANPRARRLWQRIVDEPQQAIKYNIFGTRTGRLGSSPGSFPILNLDKRHRRIVKPVNDFLVELDYNAAELRVLLALLGKDQPEEDIHEWNLKNVYRGMGTREKAKERIFAWLYNPQSKDYLSGRLYERDRELHRHWDGQRVETCFDRVIEADEKHALNYLIQSTTADLVLRQMIALYRMLKEKKSFISFCLHDSVVIDLHHKERDMLVDLLATFSDTSLGKMRVNLRVGTNYGEMKELTWTR